MENSSPNPLVQAWPGLVALVVTIVGIVTAHAGLSSQRPPADGGADSSPSKPGKVPARLWQDPLGTVGAELANHPPDPNEPLHSIASRGAGALNPPEGIKKVIYIFDCLYPENSYNIVEQRRRERYATLSALSTAGFGPNDPEHLYYAPLEEQAGEKSPREPRKPDANGAGWKGMVIPYEWMVKNHNGPGEPNLSEFDAVCVLWVPATDNMKCLHCLRSALDNNGNSEPAFAVKGIIDSTALGTLQKNADGHNHADKMTLYVHYSTAPSVRGKCPPDNSGLDPEYVIETDDKLARALVNELENRGVRTGRDPMAIVANWDETYGKEMHDHFHNAVKERHPEQAGGPGQETNELRIYDYSYVQGLDGTPLYKGGSGPKQDQPPAESAKGEGSSGAAPAVPQAPSAREGQGEQQIDYLRRLADKMKTDHPDLKAIGVLGYDSYDKLLLLQALRPKFPNAVFFTTDLDAQILQPANYSDTRNLLIAAPYDLSLSAELQRGIPPFRDSYATASYLATLRSVRYSKTKDDGGRVRCEGHKLGLADLSDPNKAADMPVHVYEVGKHGPYQMGPIQDPIGPKNLRQVPWLTRDYNVLWIVGAVALLLVTQMKRFTHPSFGRRPKGIPVPEDEKREPGWLWWRIVFFVVAGAVALALFVVMYWAHKQENQEPVELFEGISCWPTIVLWAFAVGVCVFEVFKSHEDLRGRSERIRSEIFLEVPPAKSPSSEGKSGECPPTQVDVRALYEEFERDEDWRPRLIRCFLLVALVFSLLFIAGRLAGSPSLLAVPLGARGPLARWTTFIFRTLVFLSLTTLLMFVLDCTAVTLRFVRNLYRHPRHWPPHVTAQAAEGRSLDNHPSEGPDVKDRDAVQESLDYWLQLQLIDRATNVVARLILCPFIVLVILVVAQNRIFDDWHLDVSSILVALICILTVIVCAVSLQNAAKRAKDIALDKLDQLLLSRVGRKKDRLGEKLRRVRDDIAGLNSGAFAGWRNNPVAQAILLAVGGGGALAALEAILPYISR